MQFVFNHTTFDPNNAMDQVILEAYRPLGIRPGKAFDGATAVKLDGALLREVAAAVARQALASQADPEFLAHSSPRCSCPRGRLILRRKSPNR